VVSKIDPHHPQKYKYAAHQDTYVMKRMLEPIYGRWYVVVIDKILIVMNLFLVLIRNNTYATNIIQSKYVDIPNTVND
jgi:hypothetical protein